MSMAAHLHMMDAYVNMLDWTKKGHPNRLRVDWACGDARRFAFVLNEHKQRGDALSLEEAVFLDAFREVCGATSRAFEEYK
jgi:hypothetical protein